MQELPIGDPADIAGRFLAARRAAAPLADYPGCQPVDLTEAYRIQDHAIAGWGHEVIGWKVGRVLPPLSDTLGTERLAGPIFAATGAATGEAVAMPVFSGGFAAGEAEFLLRIGAVPPAGQTRFSLDEAAALIDAVHVGIEIASSPLATINALGPLVVISDFGNNNGLVIGPAVPDWRTSGFEQWDVTTLIDGKAVGRGQAAAFPDGAIGSARFLFELMAARGIALRPGQWISSGAIGGVHDARAGQRVEADFGGRFSIACDLIEAQPDRA